MDLAPYEIVEPSAAAETPVIVEVPHAGIWVPPEFAVTLSAPARAIARDADLLVDELYADAPLEGATLLYARVSRYVIDLNRAPTDLDPGAVEGASPTARLQHGLVWRATRDQEPALSRPLTRAELEERMSAIWRPYHDALARAVERKRARFGLAIVVAAHSMPSAAPSEPKGPRADVVPGTRGRTSAAAPFIDAVEAHAVAAGWTVRHDQPYAGGYTTQHYGRPASGVHAVQVELARRLYLDEESLRRRRGALQKEDAFEGTRSWCRALVAKLGKTRIA